MATGKAPTVFENVQWTMEKTQVKKILMIAAALAVLASPALAGQHGPKSTTKSVTTSTGGYGIGGAATGSISGQIGNAATVNGSVAAQGGSYGATANAGGVTANSNAGGVVGSLSASGSINNGAAGGITGAAAGTQTGANASVTTKNKSKW